MEQEELEQNINHEEEEFLLDEPEEEDVNAPSWNDTEQKLKQAIAASAKVDVASTEKLVLELNTALIETENEFIDQLLSIDFLPEIKDQLTSVRQDFKQALADNNLTISSLESLSDQDRIKFKHVLQLQARLRSLKRILFDKYDLLNYHDKKSYKRAYELYDLMSKIKAQAGDLKKKLYSRPSHGIGVTITRELSSLPTQEQSLAKRQALKNIKKDENFSPLDFSPSPVVCYSCGIVLNFEGVKDRIKKGIPLRIAMDQVGAFRVCCSMVIMEDPSVIELQDKVTEFVKETMDAFNPGAAILSNPDVELAFGKYKKFPSSIFIPGLTTPLINSDGFIGREKKSSVLVTDLSKLPASLEKTEKKIVVENPSQVNQPNMEEVGKNMKKLKLANASSKKKD